MTRWRWIRPGPARSWTGLTSPRRSTRSIARAGTSRCRSGSSQSCTTSGAAWYQRALDIPEGWKGRNLLLTLERPHIETRAWLDGRTLGSRNSLSTPHQYELGTSVTPGKHLLTLRIDNRLVVDVGINSHSVSDHTQGNWNGVAGEISLRALPPVWIADLQVFPRLAARRATVRGRIGNATGLAGKGVLELAVTLPGKFKLPPQMSEVQWFEQGGTFSDEIRVEGAAPCGTSSPRRSTT